MAVYRVHELNQDLSLQGHPRLRRFARMGTEQNDSDQRTLLSLDGYDRLRRVIGYSMNGDPREYEASMTVVVTEGEHPSQEPLSSFLKREVSWAERFDTVLVAHDSLPPSSVDGALLYLVTDDAAVTQRVVASTNNGAFFVPRFRRFVDGYVCTLRPGDRLYAKREASLDPNAQPHLRINDAGGLDIPPYLP